MESNWSDDAEQQAIGPPRRRGRLIGLFVILAAIVGVAYVLKAVSVPPNPTVAVAVGKRFEKLHFEPLTDDATSLQLADLQGQVVLINFWGPWCGPCVQEFPELVELQKSLKTNADFRFVSVSCPQAPNDPQHDTRTAAFLKMRGYDLPIYRDPQFVSAQALGELNSDPNFGFPTTVLLDRDGVIRSLWIGYRNGVVKEMREQASELLKAK
ncbi:TlpA disulfide reductase family protein [Anatilimnocola floriformis]|uniref:TlpA disulfide reductase family protein n=1 Tax=Anatilimnocola floriformis TaxID=2948575 RepID=UPI0020C29F77|nr:TlpA disulfide reductase family protein [Anatilimnocola floriformis]